MLKLIIADDERIIRESISTLINWSSLGIELIGLCSDGIEAYNMILDECPDIVLTDIRMPGGDGIELACKIYEKDRSTVIIFLTAYSELELMKKAMHVNAVDYILKPVSLEELAAALTRAAEKINSFSRKNKVMLRGKFFYDLLVKGQRFGKKEF